VVKIWGNVDSVNVQKVLWCCEELSLPYECIDARKHFGTLNSPAFKALNPNALMPTIEDNSFVVWESNTIVRYMCATYAPATLWPADVKARANAERWMDWASSTLWPTMLPLFRAYIRTPVVDRDESAIVVARLATIKVLEILDAHLSTTAFVGGDAFAMADIAVGCAVWRWFVLPLERPDLPHLQRWFDELGKRAAYRKIVMQPLI
jgi:glutathione S-transferase